MDKNSDPNFMITSFLRNLANDIEEQSLSNLQLQRVGEFYMSYLFAEQVLDDRKKGERKSRKRRDNMHSNDDFAKFISLGYYVYNHIVDGTTLPSTP